MQILNNISSNHYNYIKEILLNGNELHIISPYLMESFDNFINEIKDMGIENISLTTTLKDNDPDLFKKANSLHSFAVNCFKNGIDYSIHIDNKLHGKIYISLKDGEPIKGIITSANFTDAGLGFNHEWGVSIDETTQLKLLLNDIASLRSPAISEEELVNIIMKIDNYSKSIGKPKNPKVHLKVSDLLNQQERRNKSDQRYFIKPVGWSQQHFSTSRVLSNSIETLHFSKRRPSKVRVGDILICYGVGTTKLLGYFEVIEEPVNSLIQGDRWPWSVKAKNLCPEYSERWNQFNNTISRIQASYKSKKPITNAGGNSLGALNFGADKIQLTEEFADHVISIIKGSI